jgi:hypothetical protein
LSLLSLSVNLAYAEDVDKLKHDITESLIFLTLSITPEGKETQPTPRIQK